MNYENDITYNDATHEAIITMTGIFAMPGDPPVSRALESFIGKDIKQVTVNISKLTMITSTGIRHLIMLKEYVAGIPANLVLKCANTHIYSSLCDLNLDSVFIIERM